MDFESTHNSNPNLPLDGGQQGEGGRQGRRLRHRLPGEPLRAAVAARLSGPAAGPRPDGTGARWQGRRLKTSRSRYVWR